MTEQERSKDWSQYAKVSLTEYGRFDALMSAWMESPRMLQLVLKELGLKSIEDVLKWCWQAPNADRGWMRDPSRIDL